MFRNEPVKGGVVAPTDDPLPADKSILVVDDDEDAAQVLALILGAAGYNLISTTNPQEVQTLLQRNPCRLAFVDLWMPEIDGIQVLKQIRESAPDTKVVIMTSAGDWDTYMECLSQHALDYVQKPVRRAEVLAIAARTFEAGQTKQS